MKFAGMAAAALCLVLGASAAYAVDASASPTVMGCIDMSKKAKAALEAGEQSANIDAARTEVSAAKGYCARQLYQQGVDRYARALKLLGAG